MTKIRVDEFYSSQNGYLTVRMKSHKYLWDFYKYYLDINTEAYDKLPFPQKSHN